MNMWGLRNCLYFTDFDLFSTKDDDIESRDMVFRMMVDLVTIQKLDNNIELGHKRFILLNNGSSFMTIESYKLPQTSFISFLFNIYINI